MENRGSEKKDPLYNLHASHIPRWRYNSGSGVNAAYVAESVGSYTALEFLNMMSGGGLENMSIFALGISPLSECVYCNEPVNHCNSCFGTAFQGR